MNNQLSLCACKHHIPKMIITSKVHVNAVNNVYLFKLNSEVQKAFWWGSLWEGNHSPSDSCPAGASVSRLTQFTAGWMEQRERDDTTPSASKHLLSRLNLVPKLPLQRYGRVHLKEVILNKTQMSHGIPVTNQPAVINNLLKPLRVPNGRKPIQFYSNTHAFISSCSCA